MIEELNGQKPESTIKTGWKANPTVVDLKACMSEARPMHEAQKKKVQTWLDNLNVTGSAKPAASNTNSTIVPKLIRKQAEWRYGSLSEPFLSTDDLFNVNPVTFEDKEAAEQNQLVLNHQFNNGMDKISFIDEMVRAAVDEGTVIARTGWIFEEEEYTEQVPIYEFVESPEAQQTMEELMALKESSPSEYQTDIPEELKAALEESLVSGIAVMPFQVSTKEETQFRTLKNQPTVEIVELGNLVIDPTCQGNISKADFVIHSYESSLSKLKADKKYKNIDDIVVGSNNILNEPDFVANEGMRNFKSKDNVLKKLIVHEYWGLWDIEGKGTTEQIVAAWVGQTLIRLEKNPYPDKAIPFVSAQYLPVRKSPYGEPDGSLLEDNQKIMGAVTRGMIDIFGKSANGQTGMRRDMLDQTNKRKFDRGQDYEFNPTVDPRQGVFTHTYPEIPNSAQFMLQLQNAEAESLTGVKSFGQSGLTGASLGNVAAGVRGALDAASKRELGILRRMSKFVVDIGRKFISMNSELLSDEEVIRITNEQFVNVRRDDLAGNFDLKLTISTAEEDESKASELSFMLQTIGNNMDFGMTKMILSDIAKLRKMPKLANDIKTFEPQIDPITQRKSEIEVALMEAMLEKTRARAIEHQAMAQFYMARAGTEMAISGNKQADTDLKNLSFVEQESGVTQERNIQLHGAQAEAQGKLKMLDRQFEMEDRADEEDRNMIAQFMKGKFGAINK